MGKVKQRGVKTRLKSRSKPQVRLVKPDTSVIGFQYDITVEGKSVTLFSEKPGSYAAVRYSDFGGLGEIFATRKEAEDYLSNIALTLSSQLPFTAIIKPTSVKLLKANGTEELVKMSGAARLLSFLKGIIGK